MANYASKVIAIAEAEVGYLEKASNSNLDSKTGNAGSKNWTKYARDLDKISGFYNGAKNGHPWCATFNDDCFVKAYGVSEAKRITFHTIYGAGCVYAARQYRNKGRFYQSPKVGDEIFFGNVGSEYHTGLVYAVDDKYVYTIEGNTSGASGVVENGGGVCKKKYALNYSKITGYGRPLYDESSANITTSTTTQKESDKIMIELDVLKKGSSKKGQVLALQALINQFGKVRITVDGIFGDKTENAVKKYQKSRGLVVDGIVGKQTWTQLLIK